VPFFGLLGFVFPLVFVVLIVAAIAAAVGGRRDPDPTGRRPYAIYLTAVTFIALFTTLAALYALIHSLAEMAFVNDSSVFTTGCSPGSVGCEVPIDYYGGPDSGGSGREALQNALFAAVFGVVLYFHGRRVLDVRSEEPGLDTVGGRVLNMFAYAVCFVLLFIGIGATAAAVTSLVDAIDPLGGLDDARGGSLATLVTSVLLALTSGFLFRFAWSTFALGPHGPKAPPPPDYNVP